MPAYVLDPRSGHYIWRAGLVPDIKTQGYLIAEMWPGEAPQIQRMQFGIEGDADCPPETVYNLDWR